ncbi:transcriptional regulator [Martelella soudanensis]|nr:MULTISPECIES: Cro/CI family transcriptional regulator [unclassified Martelella]
MENICKLAKQKAGGPVALAKALGGVSPQAVSQWKRVPAGRVLDIERIVGVSRYHLRPDIYGAPPLDLEGEC